MFQQNYAAGIRSKDISQVGQHSDGIGDGAEAKGLNDGIVFIGMSGRRQRAVRVQVDEANVSIQEGELAARMVGHGRGLDNGRGGRHGRDGLCEAFARYVEHVDGYVEARKGRYALRDLWRRDLARAGGLDGGAEGLPVVVLEVSAGAHGELEDVALCVRGESLAQLGDAHPPFGEVEFLVELLGVVAAQGGGSACGRGMFAGRGGGGGGPEGCGCGAEDVEA